MSQQNREDESKLPRQGVWIVAASVAGIFAMIGTVGWLWRLWSK